MIDEIGRLNVTEEHVHAIAKVYPTLANGETVQGAAGSWGLSAAFKQIIPINTIRDIFDIHWINIEAVSAADVYEIVLYAAEVEIARVRVAFVNIANSSTLISIPVLTKLIPADTQIQAKVATKGGGSDSVDISLSYHTY